MDEDDDFLATWKTARPECGVVGRDWFNLTFVDAGLFIGSDVDMCEGGAMMLFRTQSAAAEYGAHDPAIASGLQSPVAVWYVDLCEEDFR